MKKRIAFGFGFLVLLAFGFFIHSNAVARRFDETVFQGKGKDCFPKIWNDQNQMKRIQFIRSYRLPPLARYLFKRRVLRRMSDCPSREDVIRFLNMTAEWQIYGGWNGHNEGGGVDFGRDGAAKPLLRKLLAEINEEEFRQRHRYPYHWYEGTNGIIYISHISFIAQ